MRRGRVFVAVGLVALLVGLAGTLWLRSRHSTSNEHDLEVAAAQSVLPNLCTMEKSVVGGRASEAFDLFWDSVHTDAHILAALLDAADRAKAAAFLEAKGFIERDLATLSVTGLRNHVPPFIAATRDGLRALGLAGSDYACPS